MSLPQEQYYTVEDFFNMPEDIRAELINGQIVYMASPSRIHQKILGALYVTIANYIREKGGDCEVYPSPFGVQLCEEDDTVVEPDISVICDTDKLNDRGCLGAPDWIIEIASPSNPSHDYITKLSLYYDAGVREYWIVDAQSKNIHIYNFEKGDLIAKTYSFNDTIKTGIYDDLLIDFSILDLGI